MNGKNESKKENKVGRRQFLGFTWLTSGLVFGGELLTSLYRFIKPISAGGFGGIVNAGSVDAFPVGSVTLIKKGRFYINRLEDGSFLAIWQRCTHLGCSVPWDENTDQFHCPCHGSVFDKVGQVLSGPAPRPLDLFPITIEGDEIFVDTENAIERNAFDSSQTTNV